MLSHYYLTADVPVSGKSRSRKQAAPANFPDVQESSIRVVLADDNAMLRSHIRSLLGRTEDIIVVGEAANGMEAVQLVDSIHPDVLLLDMEMPVMTGPEVALHLHSSGSKVRILALSAYNDREYISAMLEHGASGYLTKDQAPSSVVKAIRLVMNGEQVWLS